MQLVVPLAVILAHAAREPAYNNGCGPLSDMLDTRHVKWETGIYFRKKRENTWNVKLINNNYIRGHAKGHEWIYEGLLA